MLEIIPLGGYGEIGRNCVAIKADDELVLLDLGLEMENYIRYTEEEDFVAISAKTLVQIGAAPDLRPIDGLKEKVKAICITHAHLDHVGAVPYLSNKFSCSIHATPYTIEVLRAILREEELTLKNELVAHKVNSKFKVSEQISIEFINMTHSVPQTVMIAVHTKYGTVLYANDFKFDNCPLLGGKPNFERLKQLKVKVLICDCLYAALEMKTPSESIAREMLKDVLLGTHSDGRAIIVTTFSSHLARIKSIIDIGKILDRKVVLLGRSLAKYVGAGQAVGIIDFQKDVEIAGYGSKVRKFLKKVKNPEKYLFIATGHQGEPKAVLSRMVSKLFNFKPEDYVVFSCKVIPTQTSIENRKRLEQELKEKHVRIFKDIHVSGHACKEDHRDLLNLVKPEHIIPTHGNMEMLNAYKALALELGYASENIHILTNANVLTVKSKSI